MGNRESLSDSPHDLVQIYLDALTAPLPRRESLPDLQALPKDGPTILLFSPHPDDEIITGALPLRLRREQQARVINVAVTLGSREDRREARKEELRRACDVVGFENHLLGWKQITPDAKRNEPDRWQSCVIEVTELIRSTAPTLVLLPHALDGHPAHVGVHLLVQEALTKIEAPSRWVVETEFWHPNREPNCLLESSAEDVAILITALSEHVGEIERNPYHRLLPAWMLDNTRRGAERISGAGALVPDFHFSTLYRIHVPQGREMPPMLDRQSPFPIL